MKVSDKLIEVLKKFSKGYDNPSLLEVTDNDGENAELLRNDFKSIFLNTGKFQSLLESKKYENDRIIRPTAYVPMNRYDVVLFSDEIYLDPLFKITKSIMSKNIGDKPFLIVYTNLEDHVQSFCKANFPNNMVPVGEPGEAVACAFDVSMRKDLAKNLKRE